MNILLSFADSRLKRSLIRLGKQAEELNFFDRIYLFDEKNLSLNFKKHFKKNLFFGSRGYGYWSWKPEIILNVLEEIKVGDCLIYLDAGCHLNPLGKKRLIDYFRFLRKTKKGILAFKAQVPNKKNSLLKHDGRRLFEYQTYKWTKGDLLDYFSVRKKNDILKMQTFGAGVILVKKCKFSMKVFKEFKKIVWENFNLLDDTPSISKNIDGFIEHRHDQSIWNLLCIKYKISALSAYEYFYPKNINSNEVHPDWDALKYFPIHAKRDKDISFLNKFFFKIKNLFYKN
jgi:hypothetical protein